MIVRTEWVDGKRVRVRAYRGTFLQRGAKPKGGKYMPHQGNREKERRAS